MILKKSIIMAVLLIFSLSILLPACSKKEQAKTTRLYTREEAIKEYQTRKNKGTQIPEKDKMTRSQAIAEYQNRKNKGTVVPEKDHPNDNMTEIGDGYTFWNRPCLKCSKPLFWIGMSALAILVATTLFIDYLILISPRPVNVGEVFYFLNNHWQPRVIFKIVETKS